MENINNDNVIEHLLDLIPEFKGVYGEVLEEFGEVLPYILFGYGFVKFTIQQFYLATDAKMPDADAQDIIRRIVDFTEICATADDDNVIDLIVNGFLEHLDRNADYFKGFTSLLKPKSLYYLREIYKDS